MYTAVVYNDATYNAKFELQKKNVWWNSWHWTLTDVIFLQSHVIYVATTSYTINYLITLKACSHYRRVHTNAL